MRRLREERGQALLILVGALAAVSVGAFVLGAVARGVGRQGADQRAADLAALAGARAMRASYERLFEPAFLGDVPNPRHLEKGAYLSLGRAAAQRTGRLNGARSLTIAFPDAASFAPVRIRAEVSDPAVVEAGGRRRSVPISARADAELSPPGGGLTGWANGAYTGPLAYRQGKPMRPDVALAFDRMAAAAAAAGVSLTINSGYRSDAEQAALYARHPDPRWVAPPGKSLHRLGTELDLGPPGAYRWLAANARRFGFVQRYSWEPWHFGFAAGPAPCSPAGESGGLESTAGGEADGAASGEGLPSFVPGRYRAPIMRSAARWNVSGALLAAQLMAESGFDAGAVSPAGAQGIAQFMPGTAASYGLRNPFDAEAAIDAQAHLMSDLLRRFRSVPLALAAYNAGPGAVSACRCAGPYAETRAYVARILALLDGAGAPLAPPLEVRLVE
ncbi:MAG TPA: transglycosylase SLT domain-containing protein [Solirubrobacteraceae bacterium]|nr:transglycosylase SLT domain-containing protein [Solirubrobacteraceae bacterium]